MRAKEFIDKDLEEGWKSRLAGAALAGAAALSPFASQASDSDTTKIQKAPQVQQDKIDYEKPGPITKDSMGQKLEYGIPITPDGRFKRPNQDLPDDEFNQQLKAYKTWMADYVRRWPDTTWNPDGSVKSNGLKGIGTSGYNPGYKPGTGVGLAPVNVGKQ